MSARVTLALVGLALLLIERELDLAPLIDQWRRTGDVAEWQLTMLFEFRLPRLCVAVLVGSGTACAGWLIQKATRNPLAGPGTVSVAEAASFGVVAALALSGGALLGERTLPWIAAGLGALSGAAVFTLVGRRRAIDGSGLLLTGIALGAVWSAATFALALNSHPTAYEFAVAWLVGSLGKSDWSYVCWLYPPWWLASAAASLCASRVDLLSLDDAVVCGLGGRPERWRRGALALGSALAAACIGVGGGFAFLGFLAPALARSLHGRSFSTPGATALLGAGLLLAADVLGRVVLAPAEIPAGIVVATLGAPLFLAGLFASRRVGVA